MSASEPVAAVLPPVPPSTDFVVEHSFPVENLGEFLATENSLESAVREASGCLSVRLEEVPSKDPTELHYRTTMTFDSQDSLIAWVDSDKRVDLVHKAREKFHYGYALKVGVRSFDGWFPRSPKNKPPAMWKMNLLVLLTLYPTVLILVPILKPIVSHLDFASAMLLSNICSVLITGCILLPLANRLYAPWFQDPASPRAQVLGPLSAFLILLVVWLLAR